VEEFYGRLRFGSSGMSEMVPLVMQWPHNGATATIVQSSSNYTSVGDAMGALDFPLASWEERACAAASSDCSGHGACDSSGVCVCDAGYAGDFCQVGACPAGWVQASPTSAGGGCVMCSAGTYEWENLRCISADSFSYIPANGSTLQDAAACPANSKHLITILEGTAVTTLAQFGAVLPSQCACMPGYYFAVDASSGSSCRPCPDGGR
jgi:hypothetical protein